MRRLPIAMTVLALGAVPGCSSVCDVITSSAPVIVVTDAATGERLCDVTVAARCAGLDTDNALVGGGASGCDFGKSLEDICNVTTVTISKSGYVTVTIPSVEVRNSADCGPAPSPQRVNVALMPKAAASQ
ncbi:MAG TPA: hypothetical protein VH062_36545 [Polyangiaceae bacterium]|jgi:hypothetical protein|nr:hypothetical protein [Polyangiaceae bacterium]